MNVSRGVVLIGANQQVAEPAKPRITKVVVQGLSDLTIVFRPGRQLNDEDRIRWLQICAMVLAPFDQRLIADVLNWLLTHNDADPFWPTPQAIVKACQNRKNEWSQATLEKFGLGSSGLAYARSGPVPPDLEERFIREYVESECWLLDRGIVSRTYRLIEMPDQPFARIPRAAFSEEAWTKINDRREAYKEERCRELERSRRTVE